MSQRLPWKYIFGNKISNGIHSKMSIGISMSISSEIQRTRVVIEDSNHIGRNSGTKFMQTKMFAENRGNLNRTFE